jgi:hypothetical protein
VVLSSHNLEEGRAQIDAYRRLAREEYGRELQIWGNCYVVHGDTQKEAEAELHHYVVDKGDEPAVDLLTQVMGLQSYRLRLIDSWDFLGFTTGIEAVSFRRHDSVGGQGS